MKPTALHARLRMVVFACAALLAGGAHAQMTLYKQPNFTGAELTLRGDNPNLTGAGFLDQASSIAIRSGRWEVCTQPDYKGDCVILDRNEYPTLEQRLNHRIESVRQVGRYADDRGRGRNDRYADRGGPAIELFGRSGFRGRTIHFDRSEDSILGTGFDRDRGTGSLIINEGRWQLCSDPGYEGTCRVYEPGRYPEVGRLNDQVASLRRVR